MKENVIIEESNSKVFYCLKSDNKLLHILQF